MANWAYTDYVVEGNTETIKRIYGAILKHPIQKDSHKDWEGNILHALNIDFENMKIGDKEPYMRGFIQQDTVEMGDSTLIFSAEEAWGATDFADVLNKKMEDIKVFFYVQEEGDAVYATNDKEGKYFPDRFYVDTCIDGNYDSDYFTTEEKLYEWLSRKTDGKYTISIDATNINDTLDGIVSALLLEGYPANVIHNGLIGKVDSMESEFNVGD